MKPALSGAGATLRLRFLALAALALLAPAKTPAQIAPAPGKPEFVLILSRHGVRSPIATSAQLDKYSALPWPNWQTPPGYLTQHGYKLLVQFGAWDRAWLSATGLLPQAGCPENAVYIDADSDQRTIASGHALAEGLGPGCPIEVHGLPEDTPDPLFHPLAESIGTATRQQAFRELQEQLQNDPNSPTALHRSEIEKLQAILDDCIAGHACASQPDPPAQRLLQIPAALSIGPGGHVIDLRGPLATASTLSEDILLEYANGFPPSSVAWGEVDEQQIRSLIRLHTAYFDLTQRTPSIARAEASNLLDHILATLDQAVRGRPVAGALGVPGQKLVVLVGHDTNLAALASFLQLHWIVDGRADDTPPGAELAFVVTRDRKGNPAIELKYVVQTLRQMHDATPLSPEDPPASVILHVSACSSTRPLCPWEDFRRIATSAIDPAFVSSSPYRNGKDVAQ